MVSIEQLNKYCNGDITKIENYEKAVSDPEVMYECHHRLEEQGYSRQELIDQGLYFGVSPEDLILLTLEEHRQLHRVGVKHTDETKQKMSESCASKRPEVRRKLSEALTGERNPMYGKKLTDERKRKISESRKSTPRVKCVELGKIFSCYKECNDYMAKYLGLKYFNVGQILERGGHSRKYNLTFIELIDDPKQLELDI